MRSKKSAPWAAGTAFGSMKDGGISRGYSTTRGSARSRLMAGGMTPVLRRAAAGALLAAWAAASFHPVTEALADPPEWMLHPVDGASEPGTQLSYCTSLPTDETAPEDETARWTPETVFLGIASADATPTATPLPAPASGIDVPVDQEDAKILARLLWSSPLTNEDDKRLLCWIVFNRVDDERLGVFGATIGSVVIRREFTFYQKDAFLSDTNLRIAKEELRRWYLYLIGAVKERLLPAEYVYTSFNGHKVQFYSEIGGDPFPGGESLRAADEASANREAGHE